MKYICTRKDDNTEEIFVFPREIEHDRMDEVLSGIREGHGANWKRVVRLPISAGFINDKLECYGESTTLDLKSREQDTDLLRSQISSKDEHLQIHKS